ncbi:hypothetical protein ACQPZX_26140 [Actinoplanes sp. CA-142083]|uniref:hypothetical protein n=1 Tax=Actinoplanes sp. CA-142083 TaxID=3239903 RepID=UPI003D94E0AE
MIVGSEPVKRVAIVSKGRSPSVAVVYSTRDGDLEVLDGGKPMRWSDSMFTKYRRRYEVDISDHHLTVRFDEQPLPTQDDIYHFHAEISVAFRVTNPAEVVRRNVTDAAALVRGHLLTACRPITRMYSIQEAEEAEAAVHERFRNDALIYGGITIHAVNARLSLDEAGRAWLQEIQQVDRDEQVKTVKHQSSVRDVNRENEISLLRQGGEHTRQDRERLRLAGRAMDTATMIALHLERNPGDTLGAAKMAAELEEAERAERVRKDEQAQELINGLAAAGHLTHTDVQALLDANLRRLERSADSVVRTTATVQQPAPPPPAEPAAALGWDAPLSGEVAEPPGAVNVLPVYLVVDESPAAARWTDELSDAAQDLYDAVQGLPVRLSVLGFADSVQVRQPLAAAEPGKKLSPMLSRGEADHAGLFRQLAEQIPGEVTDLRDEHRSVRDPLIVLLCAAPARDDAWTEPRRAFLRKLRRAEVVAIGVGGATAAQMADFASYPDLGFVADGDPAEAIIQFSDFLRHHVVACGRAAADGVEAPDVLPPAGYRAADAG